jgi:glucokinase
MAVIAADLGGTKLALALFDPVSGPQDRTTVSLEGRQGNAVGEKIRQECASLLQLAASRGQRVDAIGIGVPGIFRPETGTVWAPNIPGWESYPLKQELLDLTGGKIPVCIESDRSCCILGEVWQGAARGCGNAVFLTIGTGIGAGVIVDGRVLRGVQDIAGAIGWLALCRPFDFKYAPVGCFEYHASGDGIARVAIERITADPGYKGPLSGIPVRAEDVFRTYGSGDPIAVSVLTDCIGLWGMAAANLVSIFNPEVIIFGGGVFGPAAQFLDAIRNEAGKWAQPIAFIQARFEISVLGGEAALYGAAFAALQFLKDQPGLDLSVEP